MQEEVKYLGAGDARSSGEREEKEWDVPFVFWGGDSKARQTQDGFA